MHVYFIPEVWRLLGMKDRVLFVFISPNVDSGINRAGIQLELKSSLGIFWEAQMICRDEMQGHWLMERWWSEEKDGREEAPGRGPFRSKVTPMKSHSSLQ